MGEVVSGGFINRKFKVDLRVGARRCRRCKGLSVA